MIRLALLRFRMLVIQPWRQLSALLRTRDWWEHKLTCFLGIAYAIAFHNRVSISVLWPLWLVIVLAVVSCAGYVSVINDITDRIDDERAGKPNNMFGHSALFQTAALSFCLFPGLIAAWFMRGCPVTLVLYALNWLAFTLYSAPPFRLKIRGYWGVLADTCGGQFLPTLWVAMFVVESTRHAVDWSLAVPLGLWSFALGLRGILGHQLRDAKHDQLAAVGTMVNRYGSTFVSRLVIWVIFPTETIALFCLLVGLHAPLTWQIMILHLLIEARQGNFALMWISWRTPAPEYWLPLTEYYKFYFPVTFILALASWDLAALWLLALHFVLFPRCSRQFRRALANLLRPLARAKAIS
jgi:hypothetical protein